MVLLPLGITDRKWRSLYVTRMTRRRTLRLSCRPSGTLTPVKPGWRPRYASAVDSGRCSYFCRVSAAPILESVALRVGPAQPNRPRSP